MASIADPRDDLIPSDIRPVIALPRAGLSGAAIAIGCAILAIILFVLLDARRRALTAPPPRLPATASAAAFPPVPPLIIPPATPPISPPPTQPVVANAAAPVAFARPVQTARPPVPAALPQIYYPPPPPPQLTPQVSPRYADPALVFDVTTGELAAAGAPAGNGATDDTAVRATIIRNRSALVSQGNLIAAVLETPINSSRPGFARALVSRDLRGFDGTRILIPRGSRLIGEYRADAQPGQRRVLVTWTRLIRPDGVAIRIGSPATDALGGTGIAGQVNMHFFERFASAVLQSALSVGVNLASQSRNGTVIVGIPGQLGTVGQTLLPEVSNQPTIKVRSGTEIKVFVARDLDFGGVAPRQ